MHFGFGKVSILVAASGGAIGLLLASLAGAQSMDASPEASFAGAWRVIGAKAAPWVKPHKLDKREAPLLEYAFIFTKGEVKGPLPLGCSHAKFATAVVEPAGLFQGNLPKGKQADIAEAMNLRPPEITTVRVDCDTGTFDYHFDSGGNLVTALNGVVYTLQRPEPMDANRVKAGYSGPSFDCLEARTAAEKLICIDADLSKSDRDMAAAYARLKKTETPESFVTVQASQRAWLVYVNRLCGGVKPMPDDLGEKNAIKGCLTDNYDDRAQRLEATEVLKSGSLILESRMRLFTRKNPDTEESDIYPWLTGGPQAALFNAWIASALQLSKKRMDDKQLFPFDNDLPDTMKLYAHRTYSVVRFDSKVVSLQASTYDYTGGAHEALGESSLNWDMRRSKPIALNDIFAVGKDWKKFIVSYCMKDLRDQANDGEPNPDRSAVGDVVKDGSNWLFGKNSATVHFTVYSVASFAGGEFGVEIPYKVLRPYMKPDLSVL